MYSRKPANLKRGWIQSLIRKDTTRHDSIASNLGIARSTQRAQTSLAEADHYAHIAHCKNVEPWLWMTTHPLKKKKKKKKRLWIITCTTIWVCYHYYGVFVAHLLILQYPDHHQNLLSFSLYYSGPIHKISSQSVHNVLSNVVHRQTDRQTGKLTNATKNITSVAKEVITTDLRIIEVH